jgi:hypothetical protein
MSLPVWAACPVSGPIKPIFIGPFPFARDEVGIAAMPITNTTMAQNRNTFFMILPPFL